LLPAEKAVVVDAESKKGERKSVCEAERRKRTTKGEADLSADNRNGDISAMMSDVTCLLSDVSRRIKTRGKRGRN
jgi:hypothetical protein